jgi:acyl-CoA thioester hydrolase
MSNPQHEILIRTRYSETDPMGTYYNSRVLEWFEQGRAELLRVLGKPYKEMEGLGVQLPVSEAHVEFLGRAAYDELLRITTSVSMAGRARLRFDVEIAAADSGRPVCRGHTVHAVTDVSGKPIRPPAWLLQTVRPREDSPKGPD